MPVIEVFTRKQIMAIRQGFTNGGRGNQLQRKTLQGEGTGILVRGVANTLSRKILHNRCPGMANFQVGSPDR